MIKYLEQYFLCESCKAEFVFTNERDNDICPFCNKRTVKFIEKEIESKKKVEYPIKEEKMITE